MREVVTPTPASASVPMPRNMSDIYTIDNAIKQIDKLRSYCGKCHFKDERQHTFRPQPFFVFIYHSTLLFLKLAAKLQEKQASRFKVEG